MCIRDRAIEYHGKLLKIAIKTGDLAAEGGAYGNLGIAYQSLGENREAIEYQEKHFKIAIRNGDRSGEGSASGSFGYPYQSLGDYRKAIRYHEKYLKIAMEIGDRAGEGRAYGNLGVAYLSLGDYRKAIQYHEKQLKIAKEIGDRAAEARAFHNIGNGYCSIEQFDNGVDNFVSAVEAFNTLRSCLKSNDEWKISFRELYEKTYTGLCKALVRIGKADEALLAAEQGRAQTLSDTLLIQYKLSASLSATTIDTKEVISRLFIELSTPIIFLATEGLAINIWFLRKGEKVAFRKGRLVGDIRDKDPICALLESSLGKIGADVTERCEDRTFGELENKCPSSRDVRGEKVGTPPLPLSDDPFKPFYDAVIGPIADMLGPEDDELVIVSDGALCLTPWAAVIESIRIRTFPSLTSYHLILSVSEGHHKKTGALLVGNPCLNQLKEPCLLYTSPSPRDLSTSRMPSSA